MPMDKIQDIKLETTAKYQPLSDLNVRFWNQDKNTAELRFIITRNEFPLSLSKENVKIIIALESGKSFISSDEFIIDSEVEGVARYVIPTDFMRVASKVIGQIYVTTVDNEEIIVERQFTFNVSNDLLNNYPSEDKIRYIKTFDDLRTEVSSRITKLEEDLSSMEDYVTKVEDTTNSGVSQLNNLIKSKQETLENDYNDKINTINTKGQEYSTKFDEYKSDMDKKKSDFDKAVVGSGLVTTGESKSWQQYALTQSNGQRTYISKGKITDITTLNSGFYETVVTDNPISQGFPKETSNTFTEIDVMKSDAGRMQFKVVKNHDGRTFLRTIHTGGDRDTGWKEVPLVADINTIETVQGSQGKADVAENNATNFVRQSMYEAHTVLFDGSANGVGTTIPLTETLDNFILLYVYINYPGGTIPVMASPFGSNNMPIQATNIVDPDGNGGGIYECMLSKDSRTKLKIINDVSYDLGANTGSGANANKITINKIIGVRQYANPSQSE